MGENSKIEWTDHTFNPWWGCVEVSAACENCYARQLDARLKRGGETHWGKAAPRFPASDKTWAEPLKWNAQAEKDGVRRRVFCASMADVMEDRPYVSYPGDAHVPTERMRLYRLIEATPNLDWLLLTKRPQNFRRFLPADWLERPRPNVWGMTTVESQQYLWRAEDLASTPFAVRGISMEPLLGPVDLSSVIEGIDWVIAGGESGHGARETHHEWVTDLRDQCVSAGVAFFFKQWGCYAPTAEYRDGRRFMARQSKLGAGRLLDGREWNQVPGVVL